jgi:hypothetical protein
MRPENLPYCRAKLLFGRFTNQTRLWNPSPWKFVPQQQVLQMTGIPRVRLLPPQHCCSNLSRVSHPQLVSLATPSFLQTSELPNFVFWNDGRGKGYSVHPSGHCCPRASKSVERPLAFKMHFYTKPCRSAHMYGFPLKIELRTIVHIVNIRSIVKSAGVYDSSDFMSRNFFGVSKLFKDVPFP